MHKRVEQSFPRKVKGTGESCINITTACYFSHEESKSILAVAERFTYAYASTDQTAAQIRFLMHQL